MSAVPSTIKFMVVFCLAGVPCRAVHDKIHGCFLLGRRARKSRRKAGILLLRRHVRVRQCRYIHNDFVILVRIVNIGNKVF